MRLIFHGVNQFVKVKGRWRGESDGEEGKGKGGADDRESKNGEGKEREKEVKGIVGKAEMEKRGMNT